MDDNAGQPTAQLGDPRTIEITKPDPSLKCLFCGRNEVNAVEWGSLLKLDDLVVHHFCLLFSALVEQKGKDTEGIQAFMPKDIKTEIFRGKRLKCKYCKKTGATIGCCVSRCPFSYHYPCGYEKGALFQFQGEFKSFCHNHRPKQKIPQGTDPECYICLSKTEQEDAVWPPCCGKSLFHRVCVMQAARTAGYFFKCPLCNSKDKFFINTMKDNGVFVPEQDAAWEVEPRAYTELLVPYSKCDADLCLCPDGREGSKSGSKKWAIVRCNGCGSSATHMKCSDLKSDSWKCHGCDEVFKRAGTSSANHAPEANVEGDGNESDSSSSAASHSSDESSNEDDIIPTMPYVTDSITIEHNEREQSGLADEKSPMNEVNTLAASSESAPLSTEASEAVNNEHDQEDKANSLLPFVPEPENKQAELQCPVVSGSNENFVSLKETFKHKTRRPNILLKEKNVARCSGIGRIKKASVSSKATSSKTRGIGMIPSSDQCPGTSQQSEDHHDMERKESMQQTLYTKSLERKAERAKNRERPAETHQRIPDTDLVAAIKLSIQRTDSNDNPPPWQPPARMQSALAIGREFSKETRTRQPTLYEYFKRPYTSGPSIHLFQPQPPHSSSRNINAENEEPCDRLTMVQKRMLELAGIPETSIASENFSHPTASVPKLIPHTYLPEPQFPGGGMYFDEPATSSSSNEMPIPVEATDDDIIEVTTDPKRPSAPVFVDLADSDDDVVELSKPDSDPDVCFLAAVRSSACSGVPHSAAVKAAVQLLHVKKRPRRHYQASSSEEPVVICLEGEKCSESGNTEAVWNKADSYHAQEYAAFESIPHDYWLNSNAFSYLQLQRDKLTVEHCDSAGSPEPKQHKRRNQNKPVSNSFINIEAQSAAQYYDGRINASGEEPVEIQSSQEMK